MAGAAVVVLIAHRRHSLSQSGALAALVLGSICALAGWTWAALLLAFFITSTLLSKYGADNKLSRLAGVVEKGGNRDAWQVLANGGFFSAAAIASVFHASPLILAAGAGSIAASAADTWGTEIGLLSRSSPFSIITGKPVVAGQSGGITRLGIFASVVGALAMAVIVLLGHWGIAAAFAAIVGGIGGSTLDSLLGATAQVRRWCDHCNTTTERITHDCGTTTRVHSGARWIDNDAVNAISSGFGALLGFLTILLIW
jgi:uncharacterized protein (TIGR00297 family)